MYLKKISSRKHYLFTQFDPYISILFDIELGLYRVHIDFDRKYLLLAHDVYLFAPLQRTETNKAVPLGWYVVYGRSLRLGQTGREGRKEVEGAN